MDKPGNVPRPHDEVALSGRRLAGFSVLTVATGGMNVPVQAYLPAYYATVIGLPLTTVGVIFMIGRLVSVAADPLVGWASDRTRSRFGRRKPWILGGGALCLVGLAALFFPPAHAGKFYLGAALLAMCVGWTACSTPHYAWGGESAANPAGRSRIQAYLQTGASVGIFLVLLLPAILDAQGTGNPERRVSTMGVVLALVLTAGLSLIAAFYREGQSRLSPPPQWQDIRRLAREPDLWRIVASDFCVALGQGLRGAVFLFFVTRYMGLASPALFLMFQYAFGILASPLWARISYRLGLMRTLIIAELAQVAVNLSLLLLAPGQWQLFAVLVAAQGLLQGSGNLMLRAMIYGLADRHRGEGGSALAGLLSSVFNVTTNTAFAVAVGIALPAIALLGFDPKASGGTGLGGLHAFFALGPALGHLLSIAAITAGRSIRRE